MTLDKKLSTYLNRYHSYYNIKDAESDKINDIAFEYILSAEDKIFKQPAIALRAIKVEMNDILIHHDKYVKELEACINELDTIVSKGPRLDDGDLEKVKVLEEKRNVLVEFVYLIEDSLAYMMRMLLEHFSELERDKPFLDRFSKYLGPFDWMSNRAERFRNEFTTNDSPVSKEVPFEKHTFEKARKLIGNDEVEKAIDLLLNEGGDSIKKDLTLLKQQWVNLEKDKKLGLLPDDQSRVTMAKIVQGLLYIIPE